MTSGNMNTSSNVNSGLIYIFLFEQSPAHLGELVVWQIGNTMRAGENMAM